MKKTLKSKGGFIGTLEIVQYIAGTKIETYRSPKMRNRVVSSTGYGRNLVLRGMVGDNTYQLEIDSASIGTGVPVIADSTTDLTTPTLTGIDVVDYEFLTTDTVQLSFFLTNTQLANGTYTEFALKAAGRLMAIVAINPSYLKVANRDTTFFYTIQLTATS